MKIENLSRKQSHKFDGIRVGRIKTIPFSSDSTYDSKAYDSVKTRLSECKQKYWIYSSVSTYDSDDLVFTGS